ncbi:hypothetical protein [Streptosporangium saharense]|uniref:Uncharacterized protein n=1 Tax=Streptosporangium saharense TaxID=1706840 RepID=A0A7W7QVX2_9ACTN|nr:hypothetical protein [Streptosporangium saharense]MBB4920767.1 hypothetical protein [Streptosporangium saharense]
MSLRERYLLHAATAVAILALTVSIDGMGLATLLCAATVLFFLVCAFRA